MLWPGSPDDPVQIIDVRDLANFTIDCIDRDIDGTFNMVQCRMPTAWGRLLEDSRAVTAADVGSCLGGRRIPGEQRILKWAAATSLSGTGCGRLRELQR